MRTSKIARPRPPLRHAIISALHIYFTPRRLSPTLPHYEHCHRRSPRRHQPANSTSSRNSPRSSPTPATSSRCANSSRRTRRPIPTLILQAANKPKYAHILDKVVADRKGSGLTGAAQIEDIIDHVLVAFGLEILKIVPGRVSTETDARLSFDTAGSIAKGRQLIALYEKAGISRERVLIKIASTWEGIKAAEVLAEGRHPLQPHAALLARPGHRLRRGQGAAHLAVRRPHLRLVQGRDRSATSPAPKIPACSPSRRSTTTTSTSATRPRSWARASATPRRSWNWPAATCSPSRPTCSAKLAASTEPLTKKLDEAAAEVRESRAASTSTKRPSATCSTTTPWPRRRPPKASANSPRTS